MLPVYRYMDSYPQPHHFGYYPRWEEAPQRKPDSTKPPATYGPWSEYPAPMEYYGYCPYCPPGYYPARPPHTHLPPFPYHGPYPSYGGGFYPPPYHAPHHFGVEQPRYEYDKERHCCGCSDHVCKQKEDKGGEKVEDKAQIKNPLVWFPPEYLKNEKASDDEAKQLSGWYPFDLMTGKPFRGLQEDKSGKIQEREKSHKNKDDEDKKFPYPFPFYLIPGFDKLKELKNDEHKESDTSPESVEEQPTKLKIIPVNGDCGEKSKVVEATQGNKAAKDAKEKKIKEIHVKQIEETEKKATDSKVGSQPSSPHKSSKLPPVCLRVEPLPRKKNGNGKGASRSPSPPGEKSRATKTTPIHTVSEGKSCSSTSEQVPLENISEKEKPRREIKINETGEEVTHKKEDMGTTQLTQMEEKPVKKQLSTMQAAVLIQSLFRGHVVRKWEPLKKLKHIVKVREQVDEIKERIQTLESSVELRKEVKQTTLIGETIMSLLLQLDVIQGLHPSVREIRKAVARELVSLQERLDSLVSTDAGTEEKSEVKNSGEPYVEKAVPEVVHSPCKLPETLEKLKEAESQFDVEELYSAEAARDSTKSVINIESNNDFHNIQGSMKVEDNANAAEAKNVQNIVSEASAGQVEEHDISSVEEVDSIKNADKASGDEIKEPTDRTFVDDEKVESEIEELMEVAKEGQSWDEKLGVEQDKILEDSEGTHETGTEHVVEELPLEVADVAAPMGEDVVQELPQEVVDVAGPVTEHVVQESSEDSKHSPGELPQGVLGASKEDVQEPSHDADPHALKLDGKLIQEENDLKQSPEELPQGLLGASKEDVQEQSHDDVPSALEVDAKLINEEKAATSNVNENGASGESCSQMSEIGKYEATIEIDKYVATDNEDMCMEEVLPKPDLNQETAVDKNVVQEAEDVCLEEVLPKSDLNEETAADKNVAQEAEVKEKDLTRDGSPLRGEGEHSKLVVENEMLKEMITKLLHEGKQQLTAISDLHGRVKDLEKKLTKKKKPRTRRLKPQRQDLRCEFGV